MIFVDQVKQRTYLTVCKLHMGVRTPANVEMHFLASVCRMNRMFDLIYRHPEAPFCPTKRPVYPCPQPASYRGRHAPGGYPIQGSHQEVPPSKLPPRKGVNEQWEDSYLSRPVDERGQRGVPVILPCGCTGKWPPGGLTTNLSHGC